MRLIEHWESGIPRIITQLKECGLKDPEFIGGDTDLRINIYRGQIKGTGPVNDPDAPKLDPKNDSEQKLLTLIMKNPNMTRKQYAEQVNVSDSTVQRVLSKLQKNGTISREGSARNGKWIIK